MALMVSLDYHNSFTSIRNGGDIIDNMYVEMSSSEQD